MADEWRTLILQGWDAMNVAMNAPDLQERLEHANHSLSLFKAAYDLAEEAAWFESLIGMVHAYCHLADLETNIVASRGHIQAAMVYASCLLKLWLEQINAIAVIEELLRIKDAFGCALRQRYIYLGDQEDCIRAIELHSACVKYDFPSNELKASWNYNLSLALISLVRNNWTIKQIPHIFLAFNAGYKALQLSNWSKPLYIVTLCSFRIFIVLEIKHHSIDWSNRNAPPTSVNTIDHPDVTEFLHTVMILGGREWLSAAISLDPVPYVAIIVCIVIHSIHLLNDNMSNFAQRIEDTEQMLFEQPYEFDLRHAPYLLDLLGALVRCSRLGIDCGHLIERLGQLLLQNLSRVPVRNGYPWSLVDPPMCYYELPRLLYLVGESNYIRVSRLKVRGHRDLDYMPAIKHQRAALELTPDEHPRQLQYLLSLALSLAGSGLAQNTGVQSNDDTKEFLVWIQLISTLQEDDDNFARELFMDDECEKLDLLLLLLPLETFDNVVEWARGYILRRFKEASPQSEQHRVAGVGFANFSMRLAMVIVKAGGNTYTEASYNHVNEAVEIWRDLYSCYPNVSTIAFGYGATLSIKADHMHFLRGRMEAARIIYDTSIKHMHLSLGIGYSSPILNIQQRRLLADAYVKRHRLNMALNMDVPDDVEQAILLIKASVHASIRENMPATVTYSVAMGWPEWAVEFHHPSVLEAYQAQVGAFTQMAWVGLDFNSRMKNLQSVDQALAADASTCAIHAGNPELAVEILESCRTVLLLSAASTWGAPLDLQESHPQLMLRVDELGCKIRNLSSSFVSDLGYFATRDDRNNQLAQLRRLGIEWDCTVSKVRAVTGHEDFMRAIPFNRLASVVSTRLVISIITSEEYDCCHALLLIWGRPYVLKLSLTPKKASQISDQFKDVLQLKFGCGRSNDIGMYSKYIKNKDRARRMMQRLNDLRATPAFLMAGVLKDLWTLVMQHVIQFIKEKSWTSESLPHICINATSCLSSLPLHAAGVYNKDGQSVDSQSVLDHVICSYCPSLASLRPKPAYPVASTRVFALGAGENLRQVQEEVKMVYNILCRRGAICTLGNKFDIDQVKRELHNIQIAHFASHGTQDKNNPLKSRLLFHSQSELTVEELLKFFLPKARLAVLFACETAQGDAKLENEALHLVGAMLSIGFSGAVGTLWPMWDSDGVPVCEVFYKTLLEGEGLGVDYSRAGLALHKAVCALRDNGAELLRWATFAHFGQ